MTPLVIQKALNTCGANPKLKLTGVLDALTVKAIKNFQDLNGLTVDGEVGINTATKLAQLVNKGIPVQIALVLDCTSWDMPLGGWTMPPNVRNYRFFYQSAFPGGGYGAITANNKRLVCGHINVPADPDVLGWLDLACESLIRQSNPTNQYFALLIRGLTMGDDSLSPLEYEQNILNKYHIESQIVSEGLFAHENQSANASIAYNMALKKKKIILIGHSMGGDEIVPIAQILNRQYVLS